MTNVANLIAACEANRWPYWATDDGSVLLINADCLAVLPLIERGSVDCVTDPPYGIGAGTMTMGRGSRNDTKKHEPANWDARPASAECLNAIVAKCCGNIIWGGNYFGLPASSRWLVWDKCDPNSDFASAELAWANLEGVVKTFYMSRKANSLLSGLHPTQKPVALMQWCIGFTKGETILDAYMGSGTTGVACIRTGRKFIGIELEPKYYAIACQRLQDELDKTRLLEKPPRVTQRTFLEERS